MIMVSAATPVSKHYIYLCNAVQVIDSNTIRCVLDLGWHMTMRRDMDLAGLATPQSRSTRLGEKQAARMVRAVVEMWIAKAGGPILMQSFHPGKYQGRCIGDLIRTRTDESLAAGLSHQGLAKPYPLEAPFTDDELQDITLKACKLLKVDPDSVPL